QFGASKSSYSMVGAGNKPAGLHSFAPGTGNDRRSALNSDPQQATIRPILRAPAEPNSPACGAAGARQASSTRYRADGMVVNSTLCESTRASRLAVGRVLLVVALMLAVFAAGCRSLTPSGRAT